MDGIDVLVVRPPQIIEEPTSYRVSGYHLLITTLLQNLGLESRYFNIDFLRKPKPFQYPSFKIYKDFTSDKEKFKKYFFSKNNKKWQNFTRILRKYNPKSLLILPKDIYHVESSAFLAKIAKRINPNLKIVIAGYPSKYFYSFFLKNGIDIVIRKNSLFTIPILFHKLARNGNPLKTPNLIMKVNKKILFTKEDPTLPNLNNFPIPNRELIIERKYFPPSSLGDIFAGIGCKYSCTFCPLKPPFLLRNPYSIVKEIKEVYEKYNTRDFSFEIASLTLEKSWLLKICELIKKEKLDILWSGYANAIDINEGLVRQMKSCGCWKLGIGFESGSDRILKKMKKPLSVKASINAANILKKYKIFIYGSFIIGYPGEKKEDILATIKLIRLIKPDAFSVHILVPKPGTIFFKYRKDDNFWSYSSSQVKMRGVNENIVREIWDTLYPLSTLSERIILRKYFLSYKTMFLKVSEYISYYLGLINNTKED